MAQYAPALRRYFAKRVPPAEAEDLVQDVFLSMQVRGQIRDPEQALRSSVRVLSDLVHFERFQIDIPSRLYADGKLQIGRID